MVAAQQLWAGGVDMHGTQDGQVLTTGRMERSSSTLQSVGREKFSKIQETGILHLVGLQECWDIGQVASPIWTQFHLQNEVRAGEGSPSFHAHNSKCAYFLNADVVPLLFVPPCPPESGIF